MNAPFDNQPRTNLRRGLLQKAMTTRDRCVAHFFGFVATCDVRGTCPMQKFPLRIVQSHPDGTTKNKCRISETPRPGRYARTKIKQKTDKKNAFFHSSVPGISYVRTCRNPAPPINSSLFILTWGGVCRVLCLASPGTSRIDHSTPNHSSA